MRFDGEVAVVTGGGSGIGAATSVRLAELGARVVVADLNRERAETVCGQLATPSSGFAVDVSDAAAVRRLIDHTIATHGRIDVLINNAGYGFTGDVESTPKADWDRLIAVNLTSVFLCSKYAMPELRKTHGRIVNTASYTASVGIPDRAAYVASKGGIASLTRAMALDHIGDGVRVNAVAPGTINSPYFTRILAESPNPTALRAELNGRAPIGRMGEPEEIAEAIVWLASSLSGFVVGSVLTVDGGTSIW